MYTFYFKYFALCFSNSLCFFFFYCFTFTPQKNNSDLKFKKLKIHVLKEYTLSRLQANTKRHFYIVTFQSFGFLMIGKVYPFKKYCLSGRTFVCILDTFKPVFIRVCPKICNVSFCLCGPQSKVYEYILNNDFFDLVYLVNYLLYPSKTNFLFQQAYQCLDVFCEEGRIQRIF